MSEFNNRINAQRNALKIVNEFGLFFEPLLGLTDKAIDRWQHKNGIGSSDPLVSHLKVMSVTLFFLANRSQEQVTEDYKVLSEKVSEQLVELELEMANKTNATNI